MKVRRALVRGRYGPPKSKHSRRDVPLSADLLSELRARRTASEWGRDDDLVFASATGTPLDHSNLMARVLRPVAQEVGAPWAGFHTLRHTCPSMLFERGANAKQVSGGSATTRRASRSTPTCICSQMTSGSRSC